MNGTAGTLQMVGMVMANRWIDADAWLAYIERTEGPMREMQGQLRPLNFDGAALLAWLTGHVYEHLNDGSTRILVPDDTDFYT